MFIAGSQEWMKTHGYAAKRVGPAEWAILDEEDDDAEVCRASTNADAVRKLIALRFTEAAA